MPNTQTSGPAAILVRRLALVAALIAAAFGFGIDHLSAVPVVSSLVPLLAPVLTSALVVWGVLRLLRANRDGERPLALLIGAAALLVFAGLSLVWPKAALVVGALAGAEWILWRSFGPRRTQPPGVLPATAALFAGLAVAAATPLLLSGTPHRQPDGFYEPPAGAVPGKPGDLIRSEPLTRGVFDGARAWRILYWTTGETGAATVASGTVVASAAPPAGPRPVVAVAHGTTGIAGWCAPSLLDAPFGDGAGAALELMVAKGWVGVVSDYAGMGTKGPTPYLVGRAAAHDVFDAVRAARALPGLELQPRLALWGHSQGGQTALWAGAMARDYAPELAVMGVATFAPATDLSGLASGMSESMFGRVVSAYIAATWTKLDPSLAPLLRPENADASDRIAALCFGGRDIVAAAAISSQMTGGIFTDAALAGPLATRLGAQTPRDLVPAPVLIAQGASDDLVLAPRQRAYVAERCKAGQAIDYREYEGKNHVSLILGDSPLTEELVAWTQARLAGTPAANTCPAR